MSKDFRINCPYCDTYVERNFKLCKQYSNHREIVCDNCHAKFHIYMSVTTNIYSYEEELNKVIPKDLVNTIRDICSKYVNYTGKGGYDNTRKIDIYEIEEKIDIDENCYRIMLRGRAFYYEYDYRTVFFKIYPNRRVDYCVGAYDIYRQKYWWKGNTIDEQVDNYIQHALVKWETI